MLNTIKVQKNQDCLDAKVLAALWGEGTNRKKALHSFKLEAMVGKVKDQTCSVACSQGFALNFSTSWSKVQGERGNLNVREK